MRIARTKKRRGFFHYVRYITDADALGDRSELDRIGATESQKAPKFSLDG